MVGQSSGDIDFGTLYTICDKDMKFRRRRKSKKDRGGWTAIAYTQKKERSYWAIWKGCPLHDCIATFYQRHPEKNIKIVVLQDQVEEIKWLLEQPEKNDDDESESSEEGTGSDTSDGSDLKVGYDSKPTANNGRIVAKQRDARQRANKNKNNSTESTNKNNGNNSTNLTTNNSLNPCGGCGQPVGPVHKCDKCLRNMHPFCGKTIGEEGYGSFVRCPACDS